MQREPIERHRRHYTALFSNTARAHRLGTSRDWVVVYVEGGPSELLFTVVTAGQGSLAGRRVVRGREAECLADGTRLPEWAVGTGVLQH